MSNNTPLTNSPALEKQLAEQISTAHTDKRVLAICGNGSKNFYANHVHGEPVNIKKHTGIIDYQPSELMISARAGTPLHEINNTLAENNQMLGFEPPNYAQHATIGGTIASGFSGPRRAFSGAARDFVLGCKVINGKGEILKFGGNVIKNVAGYDVSRLMCGAFGTLGVILETSLKVLPVPEHEQTQVLELDQISAVKLINKLGNQSLPLSANYIHDGKLYIRLSGNKNTVNQAAKNIGGETLQSKENIWQEICEHTHHFFKKTNENIWRLSLPATTTNLPDSLPVHDELIEWYGGLRWIKSDTTSDDIFSLADQLGGHAVLYRTQEETQNRLQPLAPGIKKLHLNLKHAFDPHNILNPGKLYPKM